MRILLVEDEPGIARFLKLGLEEENYEVVVAARGDEGLQLALSQHFDLMLLDWMLPGITGLEICKILRQTSLVPIIFLTAKDTLDETIQGLQSGANDYIKKPFHFAELLERIKVQLRVKETYEQLYEIADIRLDTRSHQVFRKNEEIQLTLKEFDLLSFLIKNKGRVCTRTEIIEQVWDIHFEYNTGVIDVYMNSLRKKLKLHDKENIIQTIRGIGYIAKEI